MKNQKGFIIPLAIIITLLLVGVGSYAVITSKPNKPLSNTTDQFGNTLNNDQLYDPGTGKIGNITIENSTHTSTSLKSASSTTQAGGKISDTNTSSSTQTTLYEDTNKSFSFSYPNDFKITTRPVHPDSIEFALIDIGFPKSMFKDENTFSDDLIGPTKLSLEVYWNNEPRDCLPDKDYTGLYPTKKTINKITYDFAEDKRYCEDGGCGTYDLYTKYSKGKCYMFKYTEGYTSPHNSTSTNNSDIERIGKNNKNISNNLKLQVIRIISSFSIKNL